MDITIDPELEPLFAQIGPLCQNSIPPSLPNISLNGITGTWDPDTINTTIVGIYTFMFTPDIGQCATDAIMQIEIDDEIIPLFEPIGPLCQHTVPPPLPDTSLNGITGAWDPDTISTQEPGIFTFVFIPDSGQCALPDTMDITIDPEITPVFAQIGPLCQNTIPPVLPDTSFNGISGTWDPDTISTDTAGIFIHTFTPDSGLCAAVVTMDITIDPEIDPEFNQIGPLCQFAIPPPLPETSLNGITGSWDPDTISTLVPGVFTFVFIPDSGQCALTDTMQITIEPEITPVFAQIEPICQYEVPPALPDTSTNGVSGTWIPDTISTLVPGTFTFIFTPDAGQCALSDTMDITIDPEITPVFAQIEPLCQNTLPPILPDTSINGISGTWNPGTISTDSAGVFTHIFTPDTGHCAAIVTMDITIDPEIDPVFSQIGPICQNSIPPPLPEVSLNGISGTWDPDTIITSSEGIFTFEFMPDTGQCAVMTTMEIEIEEELIPVFEPIAPMCQFSIPPILPDTSLNGIPGAWSPDTIIATDPGVFTFIFTPEAGLCAREDTLEVEVYELPEVYAGADQLIPVGTSTSILDATASGVEPLSYNWTPANLLLDPSVLNPMTVNLDSNTIFTLTVTDGNGCINSDEVVIMVDTISIDSLSAITGPDSLCLGKVAVVPLKVDNFIGVASFRLRMSYNVDKLYCENFTSPHPDLEDFLVLVNQPAGEITLTWSSTVPVTFTGPTTVCGLVFSTKEAGQGQLDWYTGNSESYFTDLDGNPIPAEFYAGQVVIYEPPVIHVPEVLPVCVGQEVTISGIAQGINQPLEYLWTYPNGDTSSIAPSFDSVTMADAGDYTLLVTDAVGCTDQKTVSLVVYPNPVALFHDIDTMKVQEGYILEAGTGHESYLWNTGETTSSIAVYTDGWYIIEMISGAGCYGIDSVYIEILFKCIDVPNAFTPNGDGLNDFFEAESICPIKYFKMLIYNRWGEKLYESNDITKGWDGRKNGKDCPGDSYVYVISYIVEKSPGVEEKGVLDGIFILLK
jgi:gliding motility-associated-like protein